MEHWNNGFCEARAEVYRQNPIGRTLLTKNLINERLPHKIIIPTFQYSMCEAIGNSLKKLL